MITNALSSLYKYTDLKFTSDLKKVIHLKHERIVAVILVLIVSTSQLNHVGPKCCENCIIPDFY